VKSERESGMEKNDSEIIIYRTEDGATKIDVRLDENSVWLTQSDLVELFQSSKSNISEHIKHIFEERELNVVRKFRTTAPDGKNYNVAFYNLDVIISVGYRVKSLRGVQFRIWATERLREYLIKGFTGWREWSRWPTALAGDFAIMSQMSSGNWSWNLAADDWHVY
jgi:hypothetical protein